MHISSLWCSQEPKVSLKHKQNCVPKIPILSTLKLYSCKLVVFIDINTYILIEDRNFKTFMKENYGITLDNCYVFTKEHRIEVDTDSAQGVLKTLSILKIYNRSDEYPAM